MAENNEVNYLAEVIASGQASEEEKGIALRSIQSGVATSMLSGTSVLHKAALSAYELYLELDSAYNDKLREEIASGVLTRDEIRNERALMEARIFKIVNLERQIINGKTLFPDNSLSESDRKVLRLLSSIRTEEDKEKFMNLVEDFIQEKNSFD